MLANNSIYMTPVFTCHAISCRLVALTALTLLLSHALATRLLRQEVTNYNVQQGPGA